MCWCYALMSSNVNNYAENIIKGRNIKANHSEVANYRNWAVIVSRLDGKDTVTKDTMQREACSGHNKRNSSASVLFVLIVSSCEHTNT